MNSHRLFFFPQSWSSAERSSSQPRWTGPASSSNTGAGGGCVCPPALEPLSQRVRGTCCHPRPPPVHELLRIPALPTPGPISAARGGFFPAGRSLASPGSPCRQCCAPPVNQGTPRQRTQHPTSPHTHRPVANKAPAVFPQLPAPAGRQEQPSSSQRQPPAHSPRVPRLQVPELRRSRWFRAGRKEAAAPGAAERAPGAPAAPASGREEGQEEGGSREPSPKPGAKPRGSRAVTCCHHWLGEVPGWKSG